MAERKARGIARKKGKKNRKFDRNKVWCQAYRNRRQKEKNKVTRLNKHLNRHPKDRCAIGTLERLRALL